MEDFKENIIAGHFSSSVLMVLNINPFHEYCNLSETFKEVLKNNDDKVTIRLSCTWGYNINDEMTEPKDIILTIPSSLTIIEGWIKLMFAYKESVLYPRDYMFEGYGLKCDGTISFNYGT